MISRQKLLQKPFQLCLRQSTTRHFSSTTANVQKSYKNFSGRGNHAIVLGISAFVSVSTGLFLISNSQENTSGCASLESSERSESTECLEEKLTKTVFPVTMFGYESKASVHWLLGVSVRCMLGLCSFPRARAYSYGLYISQDGLNFIQDEQELGMKLNEDTLREHLLPKSAVLMEENRPDFIEAKEYQGRKLGYQYTPGKGYKLLGSINTATADYPSCVLRLVMLRDVKCDHVARGFDITFKRRMKKLGPGLHEKEKSNCENFLEVIKKDGEWKKGTTLDLFRLPNGRLEVLIDGRTELVLVSETVSYALFDAYLGQGGHLGSKARKSILERCDEIVRIL